MLRLLKRPAHECDYVGVLPLEIVQNNHLDGRCLRRADCQNPERCGGILTDRKITPNGSTTSIFGRNLADHFFLFHPVQFRLRAVLYPTFPCAVSTHRRCFCLWVLGVFTHEPMLTVSTIELLVIGFLGVFFLTYTSWRSRVAIFREVCLNHTPDAGANRHNPCFYTKTS